MRLRPGGRGLEAEAEATGRPSKEQVGRQAAGARPEKDSSVILGVSICVCACVCRELEQFIRFVWGRSRLPLTDAQFTTPFQITSAERDGDDVLPEAHTCL